MWFEMWCLSCYTLPFRFVFFFVLSGALSFVSFKLHFQSVLSSMCNNCLQASVENIMKDKMPKKGGRWWFSWRGRNSDYKSVSVQMDKLLVNFAGY